MISLSPVLEVILFLISLCHVHPIRIMFTFEQVEYPPIRNFHTARTSREKQRQRNSDLRTPVERRFFFFTVVKRLRSATQAISDEFKKFM